MGEPIKILVVDDDKTIRDAMFLALTNEGYEVRAANEGKQALELLAANPADLVITDLVMPNCDGFELMAAMRKSSPKIKIIAISANEVSGKKVRLLEIAEHLGADFTLPKPFSLTVLTLTVKELLKDQPEAV